MKSETLSLKIIIKELDFLKKVVIDTRNAKETLSIIYKKEKQKISETIRNNYLSTKNL